jgi:hypothetical protein
MKQNKTRRVKQTVLVSVDGEGLEITPFYNGDMQASLRINMDKGFRISAHGNWAYPWRITNHSGAEIWLTVESMNALLAKLGTYFDS